MPNTIKATETCLYWQKVVLKQTKSKEQKERAQKAIDRLELELKQLQQDTGRYCNYGNRIQQNADRCTNSKPY